MEGPIKMTQDAADDSPGYSHYLPEARYRVAIMLRRATAP
jgi:hypothetical protein